VDTNCLAHGRFFHLTKNAQASVMESLLV
jgi:hypothetical protein